MRLITLSMDFIKAPVVTWKKYQASTLLNFEIYDLTKNQGGCSFVYLAFDKEHNKQVTLKVIPLRNEKETKNYNNEIHISRLLSSSSHIVQANNFFVESNHGIIVMESMETDLHEKYVGRPLETNFLKLLFLQICQGVLSCHSKGVAHLDLKPENILLDCNGNIKLCDFGSAVEVDTVTKYHCVNIGSNLYAAPEIRQTPASISLAADIFSLGVILHVLLCGAYPYKGVTDKEITQSYYNNEFTFDHLARAPISSVGRNLVRILLKPNPKHRISISQAINHPWFSE